MTLKSLLILAAVACSAKVGWAGSNSMYTLELDTDNQTQNSLRLPDGAYVVKNGSTLTLIIPPAHGGGGDGPEPYWISHGTWTTTLDEFVKSGKFCTWRGKHEWGGFKHCAMIQEKNGDFWYPASCSLCGRCRHRIKTKSEWEP